MRPVEVFELIREMAREEKVVSSALLKKIDLLERRIILYTFCLSLVMALTTTLNILAILYLL